MNIASDGYSASRFGVAESGLETGDSDSSLDDTSRAENSRKIAPRSVRLGISIVALTTACASASAQTAGAAAPSRSLPAVTVEAPKEPPKAAVRTRPAASPVQVRAVRAKARKQPAATAARRQPSPTAAPTAPVASRPIDAQSPTGPGVGFSATRTTTATKTDTRILETPQSISVVTRDQIRDTGAQTIGQAIGYSPGVVTTPFGFDSRYDQILIRGFTADTVGLYRDGLRQANAPFGRFRNEPNDLERIEILRGPPSVLYGSSNPGGLINLVSRTPVERTFGEAGFDLGSYDKKQARFDINTSIGSSGNVWFRVDGFFRDASTQVPGTLNNRANISPSLLINLGPATTLTLLGNYAGNRDSMWPYYLRTANNYVYNLRAGDPGFDALKQNQYSFGYKLEHRFSDALLFRQNFRTGFVGFDGSFVDQQDAITPGQTIVPRYTGRFVDQLRTTQVDNNLQAKFKTGPVAHTVLAGVDYFEQHYTESFQLGTPFFGGYAPPINLLNPIYGTGPFSLPTLPLLYTNQKLEQVGVYGQEQATWGGLHINLGGREDNATLQTLSTNTAAGTVTQGRSDPSRFSYRAGALYLFDNGLAPYISYSTSFLPVPGATVSGTAFKPTTGKQIEAGAKYAPPGLNTTFTADYFRIVQDNVLTADPNNPNFSIQTGQVRSQGFEFESIIGFARGLNGIVSYTNTDARVLKSNNTDLGKVPVAVPRNAAATFIDYTIPYGRFAGLGGGGGVRFIGGTWADLGNTLRNNALTVFDLQGHYDTGKVRLQVTVRNLADRRVTVCNTGNCTFSEARVVLGSLTARW